jgi:rRNA biogenesis protein RRP5
LKELADGFLHDPETSFPMGRLVVGKVKAIKEGKKKGKTTINTTVDIDLRESQLLKEEEKLKFDDIKLNEKYKGIVSRIEEYGVFIKLENSDITGLVHK